MNRLLGIACYNVDDSVLRFAAQLSERYPINVRVFPLTQGGAGRRQRYEVAVDETSAPARPLMHAHGVNTTSREILIVQPFLMRSLHIVRSCQCVLLWGLFGTPGFTLAVLSRLFGRRIVASVVGMSPEAERNRPFFVIALKKLLIPLIDVFVARFRPTSDTLRQLYGVSDERLFACGSPELIESMMKSSSVDGTEAAVDLSTEDKATTHFVSVGTLTSIKGFDTAIKAVAELVHHRRMKVQLTIAGPDGGGSTGVRKELELLVQTLHLQSAITFAGELEFDDLKALLHRSAALVHPSRKDIVPKAVLEAIGAGLPVIVSRQSCVEGVCLTDRFNGLLVEADDVAGLVEAMAQVALAPVREAYSQGARVMADQLLTATNQVESAVGALEYLYGTP